MPEISQLNPSVIEDLWQNCMQIELAPSQAGVLYTYRYIGEKLIALLGQDLTHSSMNLRNSQYPYSIIIKSLETVIQERKFVLDQNQFLTEKGHLVKYRGCIMPFGTEAKGVTHLVIGLSDRTY